MLAQQVVRAAFALSFLFSAGFHAVALGFPEVSIPEPQWEHLLFVGLNLGFAAAAFGAFLPTRLELGLVVAFVIAQSVEHVTRLALRHGTPQDWLQNVGALAFAGALLTAKLLEVVSRRPEVGEREGRS